MIDTLSQGQRAVPARKLAAAGKAALSAPSAPSTPAPIADDVVHDERPRRSRKPFGQHIQKLAYPERPGYRRYWFNDRPGRIVQALDAGYEHVKDPSGQPVKQPVGVSDSGDALIGFLMEIPVEWFIEDMMMQQREVDRIDEAIRGGSVEGKPGEDGRYIPSRGIKISTR